MLARHQGLEPWPLGLEPKMLSHYTNDAYIFCDPGGIRTHGLPIKSRRLGPTQLRSHILWSRRVTIPFLWFFRPAQWPHLPQLLILGVRPVTIRLSSLSQSDGSTISPSYTIYFCDPGGTRTHGLPIKSRRLEPTQLRSHKTQKNPSLLNLGLFVVIILFYKVVKSSKNKHNTFPVPSSDLLLNHLLDLLKCLCLLIVLIISIY